MAKKIPQNEPVSEFKRGKALVVPTLSIAEMKEGESIFIKFAGEPVTKTQTISSGADKGQPKRDPETGEELKITSAHVIDLTTGAIGDLVLGFMVCKALSQYPELTGRSFEFVKGKKKNKTVMWEVYELEA